VFGEDLCVANEIHLELQSNRTETLFQSWVCLRQLNCHLSLVHRHKLSYAQMHTYKYCNPYGIHLIYTNYDVYHMHTYVLQYLYTCVYL